jgi:hypothetical protein
MTKDDKTIFLQFITLTGMFINPVDDNNVVSYIHGYEAGTKHKCDFMQLSKQLLTDKYKIKYSSDGWSGQITRLAKKLSLNWITTFKRTALEIVADEQYDGLDKAMTAILKKRIISLIGRVNELGGDPWFNESWSEEWLSLCSIKHKWFKQLWTDNEWTIIKSIDKHIQSDNIYSNKSEHIPTLELLKLKEQFDRTTKKNGT